MLIYMLLPLLILYCFFLSRIIIVRPVALGTDENFTARYNWILYVWFIPLLGLAAFKGAKVGTDSPMYFSFFQSHSFNLLEPGISFFYNFAEKFGNYIVFSLCIYVLILFFIFYGIKRNCPNYLLSLLLFVLTFIYFTSYNQLRQLVAVSVIFGFAHFLVSHQKADRLKYLALIFIALLFHNSAVFMILLFFVPKIKFNRNIVIMLFVFTIVFYFAPGFKNHLGDLISKFSGFYGSKYEYKLDYFFEVNKEKGLLQLIPVVAQMVMVVLSMYWPIDNQNVNVNRKLYDFSTNVAVIYLCLYSVAGVEAFDRIQIYFSSFNIYFYSIFIHFLLNGKNRFLGRSMAAGIIGFWSLYYVLRLLTNVQGIVPYTFFSWEHEIWMD